MRKIKDLFKKFKDLPKRKKLITYAVVTLLASLLTIIIIVGTQPQSDTSGQPGIKDDIVSIDKTDNPTIDEDETTKDQTSEDTPSGDEQLSDDGSNDKTPVSDTKADKPPKVEPPKVESPKVESPKVESPKDKSTSDKSAGANKPGSGDQTKPAGGGNKPVSDKSGEPVTTQSATSCTVIPKGSETHTISYLRDNDPQLKEMYMAGNNGEKCTAVVTTTVDGKVTATKTITVSEKAPTHEQIFVGTLPHVFLFREDTHAYFSTQAAADQYGEAKMQSDDSIYAFITFADNPDRTPVATTKGEKFVGVRFVGHDGKPIHTAGWPYGHYEYRIEGNRLYKK